MAEVMMSGLSLFLFKEGSRNQFNNDRADDNFSSRYHDLFDMKLPHQDTVSNVLNELPVESLEEVKTKMMQTIFGQKFLQKYRLLDKYYLVAIDATGVVSFDKPHCEHCLTKTSKKGKITYFHYVLEAKLITDDGHALSLASEWIENPSGNFDKQDCERKAFARLAEKIKKLYPRQSLCILADGLYPYGNAFKICEQNGWKFIFVLQEESLKTVQKELTLTRCQMPQITCFTVDKKWRITQEFRFETKIKYQEKYELNWVQIVETRNKGEKKKVSNFEYVTNILPDRENVAAICHAGRLRWKVENEGFNTQKCGGYELQHKYSRKSYNGLKNYYSLLQIAHIINQLIEKGKIVTELLKCRSKETIKNLWNKLRCYMLSYKPVIIYLNPENNINLSG